MITVIYKLLLIVRPVPYDYGVLKLMISWLSHNDGVFSKKNFKTNRKRYLIDCECHREWDASVKCTGHKIAFNASAWKSELKMF